MKKTIIDLAKELNLSPSTISKVVNNKGKISQETRDRVMEHVKASGYVAMSNARILSAKKSHTIGVVYADISQAGFEHPYFSRILQSFKNKVESQGYDIVMIVSVLGRHELSYLDWARNKKVDGILIVMGSINRANMIEIVNSDIPTISTDILMDSLESVICDDDMGARLAVEHAVSLGKKRIMMVSGPDTSRAFVDRMDAFRRHMGRQGMTCRDSDITIADGFDFDAGYRAGIMIAQRDTRPDFIFVASDVIAFGVIRALESQGIRVPDDISVLGYDDIDFAQHFTPSLSTIAQDAEGIGNVAADRLLKMIESARRLPPVVTKLPVSLKVRESTG